MGVYERSSKTGLLWRSTILVNLGYGPGEAAAAVSEAGLEPGLGTAALIRAALKRLAPKA